MSKFAQVVVENSAVDSLSGTSKDNESLLLKKQAEAEIRTKLDEFAKELSKVKKQRDQH